MNNSEIYSLSEFYKILSDPTRLKIILTLLEGEKCVQEISKITEMSQTAISYQLRILRVSRIVKFKRKGQFTYYSLDDEHVSQILTLTKEHLTHGDHYE